jgi:hypothetical protein
VKQIDPVVAEPTAWLLIILVVGVSGAALYLALSSVTFWIKL